MPAAYVPEWTDTSFPEGGGINASDAFRPNRTARRKPDRSSIGLAPFDARVLYQTGKEYAFMTKSRSLSLRAEWLLVVGAICLTSGDAQCAEIRVMTSGGFAAPFTELTLLFER